MKRQQKSIDLDGLVYGKIPPQARDLEEIVLGASMLEKTAFDRVAVILKPESFYVESHQRVFRAMIALAQKSQPVDMQTVAEQLRFSEELDLVGGLYALMSITNKVTSSVNIETYCHIIHEKFLKREQIKICAEGLSTAYEDSSDAFESLDQLSNQVTRLAIIGTSDGATDMASMGFDRLNYLEEMRHREGVVLGVPTGFRSIDVITRGWMPTYLIVLAARPSVGKTALALNLARNAASDPHKPTPVYFLCLEMTAANLYDRMLSAESGILFDKIMDAKLTDWEMDSLQNKGTNPLSTYPITLEYCPTLNIIEARAKVRRWLQKVGGFGLVIIDYMQLMTGVRDDLNSQNREQEISNISRSLKGLAGEMKIPVIALSQMSREVEKRGGKAKLSDLRESGAIEQDADVVAFLSRADYEMAEHEVSDEERDKALINFKKNRQGRLDVIPMRTALEIQKWMTLDQYNTYKMNTNFPNLIPIAKANEEARAKIFIQTNSQMTGTDDDNPF